MTMWRDRRYLIPFRGTLLPQVFTDVLVIGSGVAGLRAAIEAAGHADVIVVAKDSLDLSSTGWAQGGIAAVTDRGDSVECHASDTREAGAGLCDAAAVDALVNEGPPEVERVLSWGMRVDRAMDGSPSLALEGGHSAPRILHSDGDATGRELVRTLIDRVRALRGIRLFDRCFAIDVLTTGSGALPRVCGALTWHPRYGLQIIWARATVLAAGGAGQAYRETTNPRVATGDAIAMAWRAGAEVADLEFMQFHPTTLYVAGAPRHLISEAVRGEGATIVDREGAPVMRGVHPLGDLAPRDVVSRTIVAHLARTGGSHVFLDARNVGASFATRFPGLDAMLRGFGIDAARDPIPVHPAAHYTIGGVRTDLHGRSSMAGLYACGECAACGVHGANRLASNSLLEGLVFGRRVAVAALGDGLADPVPVHVQSDTRPTVAGELDLVDIRSSLRSAMWRNVGVMREGAKLDDAIHMMSFWGRYALGPVFESPEGWEIQNLLTTATLMAHAASARTESRGTHTRLDYPSSDPALSVRLSWSRGSDGPRRVAAGSPERAGA
jgi:L-aspartate oxidase